MALKKHATKHTEYANKRSEKSAEASRFHPGIMV